MGFRTYPEWTLPTLLLHLLLNVSSLEFHIPPRRIDSGYRIWPEYRIHSLVFLVRSLAIMTLTWFEGVFDKQPNYWFNLAIILISMAAADVGSWKCGNHSGFSRQLEVHNAAKYFFSVMQLTATAGCLYGMRRYSIQFAFCMIIQVNAFLMTLRRKNLAGHYFLITIYGVMLTGVLILGILELYLWNGYHAIVLLILISSLACVIRLSPRLPGGWNLVQNKYVMWTIIATLLHRIRTRPLDSRLILAATLSECAMVALGIYKCQAGRPYFEQPNHDK